MSPNTKLSHTTPYDGLVTSLYDLKVYHIPHIDIVSVHYGYSCAALHVYSVSNSQIVQIDMILPQVHQATLGSDLICQDPPFSNYIFNKSLFSTSVSS